MGTVEVLLHLHDVAAPLAWRGTPTRTSYDACWTGCSRTTAAEDPWLTLLRVTGRDPAAPLDGWRWDGTVR